MLPLVLAKNEKNELRFMPPKKRGKVRLSGIDVHIGFFDNEWYAVAEKPRVTVIEKTRIHAIKKARDRIESFKKSTKATPRP